jgi:hypothetical protein
VEELVAEYAVLLVSLSLAELVDEALTVLVAVSE